MGFHFEHLEGRFYYLASEQRSPTVQYHGRDCHYDLIKQAQFVELSCDISPSNDPDILSTRRLPDVREHRREITRGKVDPRP